MPGMSAAVFHSRQGCSRHLCSTPAGAPRNAEAEEASADSDNAESMEEPETGEESSEADSQTSTRRRPAGLQAVCRIQEVGLHRVGKADPQQQLMHSGGTAVCGFCKLHCTWKAASTWRHAPAQGTLALCCVQEVIRVAHCMLHVDPVCAVCWGHHPHQQHAYAQGVGLATWLCIIWRWACMRWARGSCSASRVHQLAPRAEETAHCTCITCQSRAPLSKPSASQVCAGPPSSLLSWQGALHRTLQAASDHDTFAQCSPDCS